MISRLTAPLRIWDYLVHILFAGLMILAGIYWQERLLADSSYYVFKIINNEAFHIEHNRFILLIPQFLPFIAVKLGLGLKSVLIIYSLGCTLFFYSLFLLANNIYGEKRAALVILVIQVLGITGGFFVPMFELYFCAGLLVIFMIIFQKNYRKYSILLLLVLEFFILTGHPFGWFLFYTALFYHAVETRFSQWKKYIPAIAFSVCILVFQFMLASDYEKEKTGGFFQLLSGTKYDFTYLKNLVIFLYEYYMELMAFILFIVFVLFYERKTVWGFVFLASLLFFLFLVSTANGSFIPSRYQEQVYYPLSFIPVYFYFFHLRPVDRKILIGERLVICVIFTTKLISIISVGEILGERIRTMKRLIDHTQSLPGNKFVINEKNLEHEKSISCNWSYPIETLLISATGPGKSVTICTTEDIEFENNISKLNKNNYLFRRWEIESISSLNKNYFSVFPSGYFYLNKDALNTYDTYGQLHLTPLAENKSMSPEACLLLPIAIRNSSKDPFYSSLLNMIFLSYEWRSEEMNTITSGLKTPVMADVYDELIQDIVIKTPAGRGKYFFRPLLLFLEKPLVVNTDEITLEIK